MKTSKFNTIAVLATGAVLLASANAFAGGPKFSIGGGGGGGGGNNGNKSFNINFSPSGNSNKNSNHNSSNYNKSCHNDGHCYDNYYHTRYVEPVRLVYSQCYHPLFRCCFVFPGDNWFTISKRNYGVEFLSKPIAAFNGLPLTAMLVPGQQLRLPVVNSNGSLAISNAPMPPAFAPQGVPFGPQGGPIGAQAAMFGPQGSPIGPQGLPIGPQGLPNGLAPQGLPNGAAPQGLPNGVAPQGLPNGFAPQSLPSDRTAGPIGPQGPALGSMPLGMTMPNALTRAPVSTTANFATTNEAPAIPRVAIGSGLELEGNSLGTDKGIVRLKINGIALPVEVIEWTAASVKIQLPKMDITGPVKAELEVLRADGSLASTQPIELTPATNRLALNN